MRKCLDKKTIGMAAAALALTAAISTGSAMAYFTTYATASGGAAISLGFATGVPEETVSNWTKHVIIKNTGDRESFIRVKALAGSAYQDALTYSDASGKWTLGEGGYYYYSDVVPAGGSATELLIGIDHLGAETDFNVIVVQESTPALYDKDGKPYADWSMVLDSGQAGGASSEGGSGS